jgi:predicted nucleic acid-binding protein
VTLCLDARILAEYEAVHVRPRFGFEQDAVAALLDYLDFASETVAAEPLSTRLPDEDDEPFLEVAIAGGVEHLVTGDLAHFPRNAREGVSVLTPAEFVDRYRSRTATERS